MNCPKCQHPYDKVIDSRSTQNGNGIRRRRKCLACEHRFTTYEIVEAPPLVPFDATVAVIEAQARQILVALENFKRGSNHPAITGRSNAAQLLNIPNEAIT